MESWMEYLAFLSWQIPGIGVKDFEKIQSPSSLSSPQDLVSFLTHPETRQYVKNTPKWWKQAEQDRRDCQKLGARWAWPFHPDYPTGLMPLEFPPPLLSWKGQVCWKNRFLLAVVGSRHPYTDTLLWMDIHLSSFLKNKKNLCLMSGGARGVDQKAHAISLATQNPTLCLLPCGISHYYPADLKNWSSEILKTGGAFLSVFPLKALMRKFYFHQRNKILAHLSHLVLITQAGLRSGTMVTGRYALNGGVDIAAVPGSPLYPECQGSLSLIHDGCFMARDYLDLETLYQSLLQSSLELSRNPSG